MANENIFHIFWKITTLLIVCNVKLVISDQKFFKNDILHVTFQRRYNAFSMNFPRFSKYFWGFSLFFLIKLLLSQNSVRDVNTDKFWRFPAYTNFPTKTFRVHNQRPRKLLGKRTKRKKHFCNTRKCVPKKR